MKNTLIAFLLCILSLCVIADYGFGDNTWSPACPTSKVGSCPSSYLINPSVYTCSSHSQCKGNRLCCESSGHFFCTDPAGSRSFLQCPTQIAEKSMPCYSDFNCGPAEKCCFDDLTCLSYCVLSESANDPFTLAILKLNDLKDVNNCPTEIENGNQECVNHRDCPRNQLCCLNENAGKRCSDPRDIVPGNCPIPSRLPAGGVPCAADKDCISEEYTGQKCCRLNDAHYRCAYPVKGENIVATTSNSIISTNLSVIPTKTTTTSKDVPSTLIVPSTSVPKATCPIRSKKCPWFNFNPGDSCDDDSHCSPDEICCRIFFFGPKRCRAPRGTKAGTCPSSDKITGKVNECYWDSNCRGNKKCCGGPGCIVYNCITPIELEF